MEERSLWWNLETRWGCRGENNFHLDDEEVPWDTVRDLGCQTNRNLIKVQLLLICRQLNLDGWDFCSIKRKKFQRKNLKHKCQSLMSLVSYPILHSLGQTLNKPVPASVPAPERYKSVPKVFSFRAIWQYLRKNIFWSSNLSGNHRQRSLALPNCRVQILPQRFFADVRLLLLLRLLSRKTNQTIGSFFQLYSYQKTPTNRFNTFWSIAV